MSIVQVLGELVRFAAAHGQDIAELVDGFSRARPDLVEPGEPEAPPAPAREEIDATVDAQIKRGEV